MKQLVRFEGEDNTSMWVEIDVQEGREIGLVAEESREATAVTRLEDSLTSLRGAARALGTAIDGMPQKPTEVTLDLAISFGVEGGVIVAKGSARAEASVSLTWKSSPDNAAPQTTTSDSR